MRQSWKDFQTQVNACTGEYAVCRPGVSRSGGLSRWLLKTRVRVEYAVSLNGRSWIRGRDAGRRVFRRYGMVMLVLYYMYIW